MIILEIKVAFLLVLFYFLLRRDVFLRIYLGLFLFKREDCLD